MREISTLGINESISAVIDGMFDGSHVDPLKKGIKQLIHHIAQTASNADMDAHLAAFYGLRLTKTFINSKNVIIPTFAPGAEERKVRRQGRHDALLFWLEAERCRSRRLKGRSWKRELCFNRAKTEHAENPPARHSRRKCACQNPHARHSRQKCACHSLPARHRGQKCACQIPPARPSRQKHHDSSLVTESASASPPVASLAPRR